MADEVTTPIAQTIAERYGDGRSFRDEDGVTIQQACRDAGGRRSLRDHDTERYTFPDSSVITIVGGGWDLGYPDCYCWQGTGHACED